MTLGVDTLRITDYGTPRNIGGNRYQADVTFSDGRVLHTCTTCTQEIAQAFPEVVEEDLRAQADAALRCTQAMSQTLMEGTGTEPPVGLLG